MWNYAIGLEISLNIFFYLQTRVYKYKAKETATLGKESVDAAEDAFDTIDDKSKSAWNRTKLATYDAGEPWVVLV